MKPALRAPPLPCASATPASACNAGAAPRRRALARRRHGQHLRPGDEACARGLGRPRDDLRVPSRRQRPLPGALQQRAAVEPPLHAQQRHRPERPHAVHGIPARRHRGPSCACLFRRARARGLVRGLGTPAPPSSIHPGPGTLPPCQTPSHGRDHQPLLPVPLPLGRVVSVLHVI